LRAYVAGGNGAAAKTPRAAPLVSTASEPAGALALPEPSAPASLIYLPAVAR
jgi:hypothetical protein